MKKLFFALLCLMLSVCLTAAAEQATFAYLHDPTLNPSAMADIVVNPNAVYGFSPNPESKRLGSYAEFDWTDPAFVAQAHQERLDYHDSLFSLYDLMQEMESAGCTLEEIARAVSHERNMLRLDSYRDNPEGLAAAKASNLAAYGNEEGPTADSLYEKYGSWQTVLEKAFSINSGMDAVCGLYDDFYYVYVKAGQVADDGLTPER